MKTSGKHDILLQQCYESIEETREDIYCLLMGESTCQS